MYEVFGEFNSAKEINEAAKGLLTEGDIENIKVLAKENGIAEDFVEMYVAGDIEFICDEESAAIGKLDVEMADIKATEIVTDWVNYIKGCVMKDSNMAITVKKKGKSLKGCIAKLLKYSFENMYPVDKDILKAAGINQQCKLGMPGMATAKKIIREYYVGK
ncbi:MAG: hypothetical protein IJP13_08535 [Lachnospiraceae bacterium]|nr:hypothetical protein [Lachnospiraceae bacterium]